MERHPIHQSLVEAGADHLDRVGELEAALEGAAGDAAVEVLCAVLLLLGLAEMRAAKERHE